MITLDTNALIRFFTKDILSKALQVKDTLETEQVYIPDVVFPELEYVLTGKTYNSTKDKLINVFEFLISTKNIKTSNEVKKAVAIFRKHNLDMADCIIIAYGVRNELFSFDKKMLKVAKSL